MDQIPDQTSFEVTAIPISRYKHHPAIEQAEVEADQIIDLFREFGGQPSRSPDKSKAFDESAVKDLLRSWATRTASSSGVLVWLGHGASDDDDAWLASFETPDPINGNGIVPQTLVDQVDADWRRRASDDTTWALIIIEACGAGTFVRNMVSLLAKKRPRRLALIGIGSGGAAYLGRFREALARTSAGYTVNDERVRLRDFINRLEDFLPEDDVYPLHISNHVLLLRKRLIDTPISAPVDIYQELLRYLTALSPDERSHFIPKAQGAEHGELAWYFVGRVTERRQISAWLRDSASGMLIVTGRAGTGKSALLGNVIVHTNPGLRELLMGSGQLEPETAANLPPDHAFDAVVHLTGMTTNELVSRVAEAAGVALPTAESAESGQDLEAVLANLHDRSFTILADALDEAQEPATIASTVLQRLAALPRTRVVVGTRASTKEGPDQPFPNDQDLLDALGRGNATVMTVQHDPTAIAAYIRLRLASAPGIEDDYVTESAINRIIELSSGPGREFLYARLAVHEIIANPALLRPGFREELEILLRGDHRTLFAAAVSRLTARSQAAGSLLKALALARGRGVPRADRVWATVAGAIANGDTPRETDIDHLLTAAAPYVMLDAEDAQSVYRLAHQTFREFFLRSGDTDLSAGHEAVARALMANAQNAEPLNPYIAHRLAEHVAEADTWQELADMPGVLDQLDPESVAAEALRTGYGRANLPLAIAASLAARHLLAAVAIPDRWMTRRIAMACIESADTPVATGARPTVCWAWMSRHDPLHVQLIGHNGSIQAAIALHLADARVLLATGANDGTIRLWDPNTGRPVGDPLEGVGRPPFRLAAFRSGDGRTLLAIGDDDGRLRVWNPANGQFHSGPVAGHIGPILDIACLSRRYEQDAIVTSGSDRTLLVWEMAVGRPITHRVLITGHRIRTISSLTARSGETLLVTGGYDAVVHMWDPLTGWPSGDPLTGHSAAIHAVATVALPDGRQLIAAGGDDAAILVWDAHGDRRAGYALTGHSGIIHALAVVPLPAGRVLLASGGEDATVRLWDPATRQAEGEPLTGHKQPVRALAPVVLRDGRTLLASGGEDNTVRIWDPSTPRHRAARRRTGRMPPRLRSIALADMPGGRLLLIGDDEGTIQLRDPSTGAHVGAPITGEAVTIHAVTAIRRPGGSPMLATTGAGGSVVRWDLARRRPVRFGAPLYGHTGTVRALAPLVLPPGEVRLASAGNDDKIRLWDPAAGILDGILSGGHRGTVSALAAVTTRRGEILLASAGDDPAVILWDVRAQARAAWLRGEGTAPFSSLAVVSGPAGQAWLAAGRRDGVVCVWDTESLRLVRTLSATIEAVLSLAAMRLPSGREFLVAASADGCVRLWDVAGGRPLRTVPLPFDHQPRNVITDGARIAIQTDTSVMVSEVDPALASLPSASSLV